MATAEVSIIGLGRPSASASEYIAEMHRRLERQDKVRFQLHAMGTELEGTLDDILNVIRELHKVSLEAGLPRVYTVVKIDERVDRPTQTLEDKVRSVEEKLHRTASR
ncbi:MAG: MTH1187 family thiamine-binding protein [Solirubrobacteraceae bacterium]